MKKLGFIALVLMNLMGTACAGVGDTFASGTWRYKMTVTVTTPEGDKTGSAVREVHVQLGPRLTPETTPHIDLKGEAVVVDLGRRGVLFALLRGGMHGPDYGSDILFDVFPMPVGGLSAEGIKYYSTLKSAKVTLTPEQYPMFVRFRDMNDPKSVEYAVQNKIEGARAMGNNMTVGGHIVDATLKEDIFGRGVSLKEVTIEMTKEPTTIGLQKLLPWLKDLKSNIDGTFVTTSRALSNTLDVGAFQRGEK